MASSENTTNTNFYTPMAATARRLSQSWEDVESADTSTESVDTSDLKAKDRQNAIQFHKYMIKAGHRFLTCYNQLLWYKPGDGIYTAYELTNNNNKKDLRGYVGNCPNIHEDYQESTGKQNAMMTQFFSIIDTDDEFYEKSLINTKYFMAFKNGVFDYKKQELKAFSPDYYFTLKAPIDYKDRSQLDSKTIEKVRQKLFTDIFGEEKGDFALKSLARALAGNVSEWTASSYDPGSYDYISTMNPFAGDRNNPKKVIRGGSWKDVAYFLQVSTRDFEYQDSARSYIGFRTVQDYLGETGEKDRR